MARVTCFCDDHNEYSKYPAWKGIEDLSQGFLEDIGWYWKVLGENRYHDADATSRKLGQSQPIA